METEGEFVFATSLDTKDMDQIAEFLEQSVKGEGAASLPTAVSSRPVIPAHPGRFACSGRCEPQLHKGGALCLLRLLRGADGENPGCRCHLRDRQEIAQLAQGDCAPQPSR